MKKTILIIALILFCGKNFSQNKFFDKIHQHLSLHIGYRFNNDFTIYYKDLKPFYYSGANIDLQYKFHRSEIIAGIRYMPFLSAVKPEFGFNYYLSQNAESKFNYFLHTTVFYNTYSYNNAVGYENYNYVRKGLEPANYNEVRFQSFVHDFGFGIKMEFTRGIAADFIFGGGYFYGQRDYVRGSIFSKDIKPKYWGVQYGARFSLKFLLGHKAPKDEIQE